ncbi:MAG: hypothetical protein ACXABF_14995 [Candidatus Thorarchaeota archaeon]|jgi:hypothetical protein
MSQQEELERKAYHDLYRFAKTLAKIYGKRGHWLLDHDDLIGEQLYTLAKCIRKYLHVKPYNEFTALARVSMRNCVKSLIYRATLTHRQAELWQVHSFSEPTGTVDIVLEDQIPGGIEPEEYFDSVERMETLVNYAASCGDLHLKVLNAALGGEPRVAKWIGMQRDRRTFVFKNPLVTVNAYVISRALNEPEEHVTGVLEDMRSAIYGQN